MPIKSTKLSIIIPVYNESDNLPFLFKNLVKFKYKNFFSAVEIILINDGSTDDSLEQLLNFKNEYDNNVIKILTYSKNFGLSYALKIGIQNASFQNVLYFDSDLEIPLDEIEKFIPFINKDYDLLSGVRENRKDCFIKKISSSIANRIRLKILNDNCTDTGCPFKFFKKDFALKLPLDYRGFHRFIPFFARLKNVKTKYIPVKHRKRQFGKSKFNLSNRLFCTFIDLFGMKWLLNRQVIGDNIKEL